MNNSETLCSLAMLRVQAENRKDYFDYLVPFVTHALKLKKPEFVTDEDTQAYLREEFGLQVPRHACGFVLQRLARRKLLERDHGTFRVVAQLPDDDLATKRATAKRQEEAVVSNLIEHAAKRQNTAWSRGEAEAALIGYLSRFSIECLESFTTGTALPQVESESNLSAFIVSTFVKHAHEYDPPLFESIVNLVKGHMLANALLCSDLESLQKKFSAVTFYLDTPFVMQLFGFWGNPSKKAGLELVELLKRLDGKLAIFEHTLEEVNGVLRFAEENLPRAGLHSHKMLAAMRRENIVAADVTVLRGTLDRFLSNLEIIVLMAPGYERELQINENLLEEAISEEITYSKQKALENDINSIRSIYALRKGRHPYRVEDARAVLVTTNTGLAQAAFSFGKDQQSTTELSTVVTDFSLANVAWLKAPMAAPDLPRLELIAECYATMEPSAALWERYVEEIDALRGRGNITVEEHDILKLSMVARDQLMNLTLGAEEGLTGGTVREVLQRAKAEIVKQKTREHEAVVATKDKELLVTQQHLKHTQDQVEDFRLQQVALGKKLYRIATVAGATCKWVSFWSLFVILFIGFLKTSDYLKENPQAHALSTAFRILAFLIFVWGVADAVWDISVKHLANWIASKTETLALKYLQNYFKVAPL